MFPPTINIFQFYKRLCISVFEMLRNHVAQHYSVPAEVQQLSLVLKDTKVSPHGLEVKSSPAIITFNTDGTQTVRMNKWIVWLTNWAGDYIKANKVIEGTNTVSFIHCVGKVEKVVATYKLTDIKDYHIIE